MSPHLRFALIATAACALAAPAGAQETPADSEIVVTGRALADEEQIKGFVDAFTRASPRGQLSRFEFSVCPAALGLAPQAASAVATRMRRVAKAAAIPVGKARCTPNVLLMITENKKALLDLMQRKYPQFLGDMPRREVRRLADAPGPAAAWQVQGRQLDADGVEIPTEGGAGGGTVVNRTVRQPSRITPATRPQLAGAVVIVEKNALLGLSTTQLADYAAMRAFAPTDPARLPTPAPPTILTILDAPMGSAVPLTMSEWDFAFLKSLYTSPAGLYAGSQRTAIRREMEKELKAGEQERE